MFNFPNWPLGQAVAPAQRLDLCGGAASDGSLLEGDALSGSLTASGRPVDATGIGANA